MGIEAMVGMAVLSMVEAKESSDRQQGIANYNRKVAENNAVTTRAWAAYDAKNQRRENEAALGKTRALYGASGVDVGDGSAIDVMSDDALQGELAALSLIAKGEVAGSAQDAQARLFQYEASSIKKAAPLSIATAGVKGANAGYSFGSSLQ